MSGSDTLEGKDRSTWELLVEDPIFQTLSEERYASEANASTTV